MKIVFFITITGLRVKYATYSKFIWYFFDDNEHHHQLTDYLLLHYIYALNYNYETKNTSR